MYDLPLPDTTVVFNTFFPDFLNHGCANQKRKKFRPKSPIEMKFHHIISQ